MAKMDGTEKILHPGYDAHERVVRKPHKYSREKGYEPVTDKQESAPQKRKVEPVA